MDIALIGNGAIAGYVREALGERGHRVRALVLRAERLGGEAGEDGAPGAPLRVGSVADLPAGIELIVDCAGHSGLAAHGPDALRAGYPVITLAVGALAEDGLAGRLEAAAREGGTRLVLASGAIGALDCLSAARVGRLDRVRYVGRKPPSGWMGSPAEQALDLTAMDGAPQTHFSGSARQAATDYPKNANVAAAVALAGIGLDDTRVELVADPGLERNVHEIEAEGAFGRFAFRIEGLALPDNPRSSALAAMSAVAAVERKGGLVVF